MLKVHKGRRDDVRTPHGSFPGLARNLLILSALGSVGHTARRDRFGNLHPVDAMPKPGDHFRMTSHLKSRN